MGQPSESAERKREAAIGRLKILVPALFAVGFLFYVAVTVYPLAGMPAQPLYPFGPSGTPILWFAIACASGGLLALLGALLVAVSATPDDGS